MQDPTNMRERLRHNRARLERNEFANRWASLLGIRAGQLAYLTPPETDVLLSRVEEVMPSASLREYKEIHELEDAIGTRAWKPIAENIIWIFEPAPTNMGGVICPLRIVLTHLETVFEISTSNIVCESDGRRGMSIEKDIHDDAGRLLLGPRFVLRAWGE